MKSVKNSSTKPSLIDPRLIDPRRKIGMSGEDFVCKWLVSEGFSIEERNWRTRRGEIDIIALYVETIVFIEVKTWPHGHVFDLELVIGLRKRKRMVETAKCFLHTHRQYSGMYVRFDVILLTTDPTTDQFPSIHHFKDAFSECE